MKTAVRGIAPVSDADSSFSPEIFSFLGAINVALASEEDQQGESYVSKGIFAAAVGSASSIDVAKTLQTQDATHVFDAATVHVSQTAPVEQYAPVSSPTPVGFSTTTVALYYTFGDHLGSSSVTLDASGNLVQATDYFPYGGTNVDEKYGSFSNPYTYTGKERDPEVDLYYYGARYYNAGFSRFTSVDPALFDPQHLLSILADPQSLNSYAYARNNPIRLVDPTGGSWKDFRDVIGVAVQAATEFFGAAITEFTHIQTLGATPAPDNYSDISVAAELGAAIARGVSELASVAAIIEGISIATGGPTAGAVVTAGTAGVLAPVGVAVGAATVTAGSAVAGYGVSTLMYAKSRGNQSTTVRDSFNNAYGVAKGGGANKGTYNTYKDKPTNQIQKAIKSYQKVINKHKGWIKNPESKASDWKSLSTEEQNGLLKHWRQEIKTHSEERNVMEGILSERSN